MGLDWDQKEYDENGDGRLSSREESNWISNEYWNYWHVINKRDRNRQVSNEIDPLDFLMYNILDGMRTQLNDENKLKDAFWELIIYTFSWALLDTTRGEALKSVQGVFKRYPNSDTCEIFSTVTRKRRAFDLKFHLEENWIGSFWHNLIPTLPPYVFYHAWPDGLFNMLYGMAEVYTYLVGGNADTVFDLLQKQFATHWKRHTILNPDLEVSKTAVAQWDFSVHEWACRDLLVASYPQLVKDWTLEELDDADVSNFLCKTYGAYPQTAIEMWKLLLDTANAHLSEGEAARMLVSRYVDWIGPVGYNVECTPILDALEQDTHFAAQVFKSACVSMVQRNLLTHCVSTGREELYQTLRKLLAENPLLKKDWDMSLSEIDRVVKAVREESRLDSNTVFLKKPTMEQKVSTPADDGRSYRYCKVQCEGIPRAYFYITEDNSLRAGDYVLVPFGQNNQERIGKVEQVDTFTATTAPYLPEYTKHIISKIVDDETQK